MSITEFEFELTKQITYQGDMREEQASFILLKEPTNDAKQSTIRGKLRQAYMWALKDLSQEGQTKETKAVQDTDDIITPEIILFTIYTSKNCPIDQIKSLFSELLCAGCAFVEGTNKMTKHLCESICDDDFEEMMGEYFANFIIPSWLIRQMKKS
jgi:hypothetical protein